MKKILSMLLLAIILSGGYLLAKEVKGGTLPVGEAGEAMWPAMAKLTLSQAIEKGLARVAGRTLSAELANKNGFLIFEVEVVKPNNEIMELWIDAGNGNILGLNNDKEDKDDKDEGQEQDDDND